MKKWLSALLAVCMVFSLMQGCLSVSAADPQLIVESKSASPGDTVTLAVSVKNNPGFYVAQITPVIASGLPAATWATTELTTGLIAGTNLIFEGVPTSGHTDMVEDGAVLTVSFSLPSNIAAGTYSVSFMSWADTHPKPMDIINYDEEDVVFSVVAGGITVNACEHNWGSGTVTKEATCKEAGEKLFTCSKCKATKTETIAKLTTHTWDAGVVTKAATCKEAGEKLLTCTVCLDTKTESIAKLTTHTWNAGEVTRAATCKEEGEKLFTCTVCGDTKTEAIPKTEEHVFDSAVITKEANCRQEGNKRYTCSVCGAVYNETLARTSDHKWGTPTVITRGILWWQSNDMEQHQKKCTVCGTVENEAHVWERGAVTEATCKTPGAIHYTCACGLSKDEEIPVTDAHNWGSFSVTKEPTCTEPGVETRVCSVCNKKDTRSIIATGHTFGEWSPVKGKEPTCTEPGTKVHKCTVCGVEEEGEIEPLGHDFPKATVIKVPTCTEPGVEKGVCRRCGEETTQPVPPTGHTFGEWMPVTEASCTEPGKEEHTCIICKTVESRATEPLGHDFADPVVVREATLSVAGLIEGKCERCGEATSQTMPCHAKDGNTGIEFTCAEGTFSEGTVAVVERVKKEDPNSKSIANALADISAVYEVYDISAVKGDAAVNPTGTVRISFPVPAGYGKGVGVFFIGQDGKAEQLRSAVSMDGKTVIAEASQFGFFVVAKLDVQEKEIPVILDDEPVDSFIGTPVFWVIIAAIISIAILIVIFLLVRSHKESGDASEAAASPAPDAPAPTPSDAPSQDTTPKSE